MIIYADARIVNAKKLQIQNSRKYKKTLNKRKRSQKETGR